MVNSFAVTWHIKQDGTGNFTTIQEGIDTSADSDTVLVYPDTYFENVNFSGKCITVASLFLTTGEEHYINETIIDGNQTGSCVRMISEEDSTAILCGFKLSNGIGTFGTSGISLLGGGIYIVDSQPNIISCIIKENTARSGGGICCDNSEIFLSNTKIIGNQAYVSGGGITLVGGSTIEFDQNDLCDIYLNYSPGTCEIFKNFQCSALDVYVDTFTVMEPDYHFVGTTGSSWPPPNDITMHIQNAKLTPVNADLYVSPDGDNCNSGLDVTVPLKTLNYAMSLIQPDSVSQNTIFLANGLYSKSENDQCMPYNVRGFVSIIGEDMYNTIIDAEDISYIFKAYQPLDFTLKNLSLRNGNGENFTSSCMTMTNSDNNRYINLENINISNFEFSESRLLELHDMNIYMNNVHIVNCHNSTLRPYNSHQPEIEVKIKNSLFKDCSSAGIDSHLHIEAGLGCSELLSLEVINTQFTNNQSYYSTYPIRCSCIELWSDVNLNLVNCTIGNNTSPNSGGAIVLRDVNSNVNIYNSILYGDNPSEIYASNNDPNEPCEVNIMNSLIDGGYVGIYNSNNNNIINWLQGNLNENPLWTGTGVYPYYLQTSSPCIDAGTFNLPAGIELPQYDLAGNQRIYGDSVDMGAYEWQGTGIEEPTIPNSSLLTTNLSNYPNPFNPSTTIKLELAEAGKIDLAIYNIKGQKVKTLLDCITAPGTYECNWNGKDETGKVVSSGQYVVKLKQNEKETSTKIMLLK